MRSEKEMMDLIIQTAEKDGRIRMAAMNGSRLNKQAEKDAWQDFDVVYAVTDVEALVSEDAWIDVFGEILIMQKPELFSLGTPSESGRFSYLMQFTDGNRIDLTLIPLAQKSSYLREDSLTKILLNKGESIKIPGPDDSSYWINRPSAENYRDCCNEFWWLSLYVIKGLARKELLYSLDHLQLMRGMLLQMLDWNIGIDHDFQVSTGKNHKFLDRFLSKLRYARLLNTFSEADVSSQLQAFWIMTALFEEVAAETADYFSFSYTQQEAEGVKQFIRERLLQEQGE